MTGDEIVCPFCDQKGFDLIGLKYHLNMYCEAFQCLDVVAEMEAEKAKLQERPEQK